MDVLEEYMALANQWVLLVALVSARMIPLVQIVPYLGGKATPQVVKMGLAMALSLLVVPVLWGSREALPESTILIAALIAKEVLIGLTLGFVAALVFEAIRMAGQIIDTARGQTMATALVPQLPERISVSADFLYQMAIAIFLILGGHRIFLAALTRSYIVFPVHEFPSFDVDGIAIATMLARWTADSFNIAMMMAFPVVASILLADLLLALVNKAAPGINVFFLGMPLKALLGVLALMLSLDILIFEVFISEAVLDLARLEAWMESLSSGGAP